MEYWKDANEAMTTIHKFLEAEINDPELGEAMKKLGQLIVFDYSEDGPGAKVWLDTRNGQASAGMGDPEGKPDLIMSCSTDDAHRAWSDKLNAVVAITRKKVRVQGSATGLLKLVPKAKKGAQIYNRVLTELGMADKIIK
ncbi:MAG: SCP2 sterol-binding domain-containing protein [Deltaproteobacteria bacterium]